MDPMTLGFLLGVAAVAVPVGVVAHAVRQSCAPIPFEPLPPIDSLTNRDDALCDWRFNPIADALVDSDGSLHRPWVTA
jgi:hypothetical protein